MRMVLASLVALSLSLTTVAFAQKKLPDVPGLSYVVTRSSIPKEIRGIAKKIQEAFPKHKGTWTVQVLPSRWFVATSVITAGDETRVLQVSGSESGLVRSSSFTVDLTRR